MSAAKKCGDVATATAAGALPLLKKHRPMLTDQRRDTLKNMYSLVGSHSAVKLCRWQKAMMRGRGGCYKCTFYGIRSHQCMEATPSMACANKCTFCWRLNTNPTAKEWKWAVDEPQTVAAAMIEAHKALIQNASGMPGVTKERLSEAMQPSHVALSLVGEPILYPRINEFLQELHNKRISTFLVNNGQFPSAIEAVAPVTQLYLSIDATEKDAMKRLDRPIFTDFWERFNESVGLMATKEHRTAFRMTMIKGFNMGHDDVPRLVDLVLRGKPHLIELKQLTPAFQGSSKTFLRMENVPTFDEVIEFGKAIAAHPLLRDQYAIACAHCHSNCLLLARKDMFLAEDGVTWRTWIDFNKFADHYMAPSKSPSLGAGNADGAVEREVVEPPPDQRVFAGRVLPATEYTLPTPDWALFGASEEGFDPDQVRHRRAKALARIEAAKAKAQHEDHLASAVVNGEGAPL